MTLWNQYIVPKREFFDSKVKYAAGIYNEKLYLEFEIWGWSGPARCISVLFLKDKTILSICHNYIEF